MCPLKYLKQTYLIKGFNINNHFVADKNDLK